MHRYGEIIIRQKSSNFKITNLKKAKVHLGKCLHQKTEFEEWNIFIPSS